MCVYVYVCIYIYICICACVCKVAQSCPTLCDPWTVAYQASPSMGFSRQEYWSGLPFPSPGDLTDPGIEPGSPALEANLSPRSTIQHCIANLGDSKEEGMR